MTTSRTHRHPVEGRYLDRNTENVVRGFQEMIVLNGAIFLIAIASLFLIQTIFEQLILSLCIFSVI